MDTCTLVPRVHRSPLGGGQDVDSAETTFWASIQYAE